MHLMKLHSHDVRPVLAEARREHKSKVGSIDPARTHLNYNLNCTPGKGVLRTADDFRTYIKELGVSRKIKADAVLCYSTVITMPKDYEGDSEAFFKTAYKALRHELCHDRDDLVVQAEVHLDEETPHMHFASIPIVEKDGKVKLSAKDITGNKSFLLHFHPNIERYISQRLGVPVHLYDADKCDERRQAREQGDRSKDYETIEEYKGRKEKEHAYDDLLNGIALETRNLTQIRLKQEKADKELAEKLKALKTANTDLETVHVFERVLRELSEQGYDKLYNSYDETTIDLEEVLDRLDTPSLIAMAEELDVERGDW